MHPVAENDPRQLPIAVVGFEVSADQALPCGQEVCTPLAGDCRETGTDREQAIVSCARFMAATALSNRNSELMSTVSSHELLIEQLSIDRKTGILTLNANDALFDRLRATGLLERMRNEGYVLQLTFGDIDRLKEHNNLGDHAGGDEAIKAGATVLRQLYRRDYDVVGILDYEREAAKAVEGVSGFTSVSRFASGDELIAMSFLPPMDRRGSGRRGSPTAVDLQDEVGRITRAFRDLYVEYPLKSGVNVQETQVRLAKEGFIFSLMDETYVRAPVSMTFATVMAEMPRNQEEFEAIKGVADAAMMVAKRHRRTVTTHGASSYLLSEPNE